MPRTTSRSAPTSPRFRQIVDRLKRGIDDGTLCEHQALPSERILAEEHDVSRMTARRALEAIEREGLAYRDGKKGRFVSPKRLNYNINTMVSFVADAEAAGIDLQMELIRNDELAADAALSAKLSCPLDATLNRYERLFRNCGHATFLETEFVIASRREEFLNLNSMRSAPLLDQRFSPLGHSADIVVRMRAVGTREAEILGLAAHQSATELEQTIRDAEGNAFCLSYQVWRGELAQFSARAIVER